MYLTDHQTKALAALNSDLDIAEHPDTGGLIEVRVFKHDPKRWLHDSIVFDALGNEVSRMEVDTTD